MASKKAPSKAVAKPAAPAPDTFMKMIERVAATPNINPEMLDRLVTLQERVMRHDAKASYIAALVAMKPMLPAITRQGLIEIREKDNKGGRTGPLVQSTAFARWEDIDEAITPILHEHGFVLSFRSEAVADGRVVVTAVLSHANGHEESTSIPPLPFDTTGSKNNVQAIGSSLSYGKRYAATLLLNIRTIGEDDDGKEGDNTKPGVITDQQRDVLQGAIIEAGADIDKVLTWAGVESLSDLPASRYDELMRMLEQRRGQGGKR